VVLEAAAIVFLFAKVGLKYLPKIVVNKTPEDTVLTG
jgi:hypothetical protein